MSRLYRCESCGAVYADQQADGSLYHHVCHCEFETPFGPCVPARNGRNENIVRGPGGVAVGIIAEGKGVTPIDKGAPAEPAWITQLKARLRADDDPDE